MITWKDFILDDVFGPTLMISGEKTKMDGKSERNSLSGIMDDARTAKIQETRQADRAQSQKQDVSEHVLVQDELNTKLGANKSLESAADGMEASRNSPDSLLHEGGAG